MRLTAISVLRGLMNCLLCFSLLAGCKSNDRSDGYGNFEATEIIVSSEASGKLLRFEAEEGRKLAKGSVVGLVDTTQLHFTLRQLQAEREAMVTKVPGLGARIGVLQEERRNMQRDRERYRRLVEEGAVPSKQLENIENGISVTDRQIASLETEAPGIAGEIRARDARIAQLDDQIRKSVVRNPVEGMVLTRYAEEGELTSYGKALYKIADLHAMFLRVYLSGAQLSQVRIGQEVEVLVDTSNGAERSLKGKITWISAKAEFTPKIIQTKEERVSMVYAVKVLVDNREGLLKIGMPGEMRFLNKSGS
ncbi:MAG: HlyD family efflux transporter periplasmic adaptor subunit [Chlorobium sp.]